MYVYIYIYTYTYAYIYIYIHYEHFFVVPSTFAKQISSQAERESEGDFIPLERVRRRRGQ